MAIKPRPSLRELPGGLKVSADIGVELLWQKLELDLCPMDMLALLSALEALDEVLAHDERPEVKSRTVKCWRERKSGKGRSGEVEYLE